MNSGDLTTLANAKQWLGLSGLLIAGITNANPAVVTITQPTPIPLVSGLVVGITAVNGMTEVNGNEYAITVISPTTFSIPTDSTAFGAYTSGGLAGISDSLMQRLVSAVSTYIQSWLNRTIRNQTYAEVRSGTGGTALMLLNYPITNVSSLVIDGINVVQRPALGAGLNTYVGFGTGTFCGPGGYTWDGNRVMLSGGLYFFARGYSNVNVIYDAGFLVSNEAQTIPATAPYVLMTQQHWNAGDRGVLFTDGTALLSVTGAPAQGQYNVDGNGVYTFNAADAGAGVLISYGYVPFDIEQAAVDMIGDWFKYMGRIGTLSMTIETQSITYVNAAITARALGVLNQYKRVAPIAQ